MITIGKNNRLTKSIMKVYIGLDNGVTGTIAIISETTEFIKIPVKKEQNYTKKKDMVTRLDYARFKAILEPFSHEPVFLLIERPLVNPQRFKATISAVRCIEAELIAIEELGIPFQYCDSKEWQRELLPKGVEDTKKASLDIGNRLFPMFKDDKHQDRDSLLIAEYARRKCL